MVIKVFFTVLVLCTVAVVAVILAIHFRVKRHLEQPAANPATEVVAPQEPIAAQVYPENDPPGNGDAAVEEKRP